MGRGKEDKTCERLLKESRAWLSLEQCFKGITVLVQMISVANVEKEEMYIRKGIDLLQTCLMEHEDADIPDSVFNIPGNYLTHLLDSLKKEHKWTVVIKLIRMGREQDENGFEDFTGHIDIDKIILEWARFSKDHTMLEDILRHLFDIGVEIKDDGKTCVCAAIQAKQYQLIPLLLENGANCVYLSLSRGDTPIHAAVSLGLDTGKFDVFKFLLKKFKNNDPGYEICDPNTKDNKGNGLFHIVLQQKHREITQIALKLLINNGVSTICLPNKKGIFPIELINKKKDSRWQVLVPYLSSKQHTKPKKRDTSAKYTAKQLARNDPRREIPKEQNNTTNGTINSQNEITNSTSRINDEADATYFEEYSEVTPKADNLELNKISSESEHLLPYDVKSSQDRTSRLDTEERDNTPSKEEGVEIYNRIKYVRFMAEQNQKQVVTSSIETSPPSMFGTISHSVKEEEKKKTQNDKLFISESNECQMDIADNIQKPYTALCLKENEENSPDNLPFNVTSEIDVIHGEHSTKEDHLKTDIIKSNDKTANIEGLSGHSVHKCPLERYTASNDSFSEEQPVRFIEDGDPLLEIQRLDTYDRVHGQQQSSKNGLTNSSKSKLDTAHDDVLCPQIKSNNEDEELISVSTQHTDNDEPILSLPGINLEQQSIFEDIENLPWQMECTREFWKSTGKLDSRTKEIIFRTLRELANGNWHFSICKKLTSTKMPKHLQLFESKITKGSRIIWEIAFECSPRLINHKVNPWNTERKDLKQNEKIAYCDVIRVWNYVSSHDGIYKVVSNICNSTYHGMSHEPYKYTHDKQNLPRYLGSDTELIDIPLKKTDSQVTKFYSVSNSMLKHIYRNTITEVDFPFRVNNHEHFIVHLEDKAPILLIGRSGTGKTTCCLYRLLIQFVGHLNYMNEEGRSIQNEGISNDTDRVGGDSHQFALHQIFVTKNELLCNEAKKHFREMVRGVMSGDHVHFQDGPIPMNFADVPDTQYPLFLTHEKLLYILDTSVGEPHFFSRNKDGTIKGNRQNMTEEYDYTLSEFTDFTKRHQERDFVTKKTPCQQKQERINYDLFLEKLWPKISSNHKGYQPSLVWTEIVSVIKGSHEALQTENGFLTLKEYEKVGKKRAPSFSGKREEVYQMFEKYKKLVKEIGFYDGCDVIHSIHSRLKTVHVHTWQIHQVFIDEIQDFTQAEIFLLARMCQDPNEMFLTGDTAQTVMQGIEFRFCDIRSLFHAMNEKEMGKGQGNCVVNVPEKIYQLNRSYRSHKGILALASSILDIMAYLFPASYDQLQKDSSPIDGDQPVLVESAEICDFFRNVDNAKKEVSTRHIELGAHQAVIVMNEIVREQLPEVLKQNITLTIYESKGLEFDRIILFNFFKHSQASKEWRIITDVLREVDHSISTTGTSKILPGICELDIDFLEGKNRPRPLAFDQKRHKILNSELKLLYTAVTRARCNVWIFDEDEENRAPMFDFFKVCKLATVMDRTRNDFMPESYVRDSTTDDWIKRGEILMKSQIYREAEKCFRNGRNEAKADDAKAHLCEQNAYGARDKASKMQLFRRAANLYKKIKRDKDAIRCFKEADDFLQAAQHLEEIGKPEHAAELYLEHLRDPLKSSRCYEKAQRFDLAVKTLHDKEYFDEALEVLSRFEDQTSQGMVMRQPQYTKDDISLKAAAFHHRRGSKERMQVYLERVEFSVRYNFLLKNQYIDLAAEELYKQGKLKEATKLYLSKGELLKASKIAKESGDSTLVAVCLINDIQISMQKKESSTCTTNILEKIQELMTVLETDAPITHTHGEAYLLRAEYYGGNSIQDIKTALRFFKRCDSPCIAGQVECVNLLTKRLNKEILGLAISEMSCLSEALNVLSGETSSNEPGMKKKLFAIFNYYGFETREDGSLVLNKFLHPRGLKIVSNPEEKEPVAVRSKIKLYLLDKIPMWYKEIVRLLEESKDKFRPCTRFKDDFQCVDESCVPFHGRLTVNRLKQTLEIDLMHVEIDNYIEQCSCFAPKGFAEDIYKSSRIFFKHLLPDEFVSFDEGLNELAKDLRNTILKKHAARKMLCNYLNKELDEMKKKERKKCIDLFVNLHWQVKFLRLPVDVQSIMQQFDQRILDEFNKKHGYDATKVAQKVKDLGFLTYLKKEDKNKRIECLAVRFHESCDLLEKNDYLSSLMQFTKFLSLVGDERHKHILPRDCFLIMWLEYFVTMSSCLISNNDKQVCVILPASYCNVVAYIDSSLRDVYVSTFSKIRNGKKQQVELIEDRMGIILTFLCGNERKISFLGKVFKESEKVDFALLERVMVLVLTSFCNMRQASLQSMILTELDIIKQLCSIKQPTNSPIRLAQAIEGVKASRGMADIGNTLQDLLVKRGDNLKAQQWRRKNFESIPGNIVDKLSPEFQCKETNDWIKIRDEAKPQDINQSNHHAENGDQRNNSSINHNNDENRDIENIAATKETTVNGLMAEYQGIRDTGDLCAEVSSRVKTEEKRDFLQFHNDTKEQGCQFINRHAHIEGPENSSSMTIAVDENLDLQNKAAEKAIVVEGRLDKYNDTDITGEVLEKVYPRFEYPQKGECLQYPISKEEHDNNDINQAINKGHDKNNGINTDVDEDCDTGTGRINVEERLDKHITTSETYCNLCKTLFSSIPTDLSKTQKQIHEETDVHIQRMREYNLFERVYIDCQECLRKVDYFITENENKNCRPLSHLAGIMRFEMGNSKINKNWSAHFQLSDMKEKIMCMLAEIRKTEC